MPVRKKLSDQIKAQPSKSQKTERHLIVQAYAGTGKTTTIVEGLKALKNLPLTIQPSPQQDEIWKSMMESRTAVTIGFCAFNKSIADELQRRIPPGCEAMTLHRLGNRAVCNAYGRVKPIDYRTQNVVGEILGRDPREIRQEKPQFLPAVDTLVAMCKVNLIGHGQGEDFDWRTALDELAAEHCIDLNGSQEEIYSIVPKVLQHCREKVEGFIDYNDMIWLPVVNNLAVSQFDLLMVDEAQDLNRCQQALARMAGRRLVFVGDTKQAIYGFAGADSRAMLRLQEELDAEVLPLTVTRRCGKRIVEEAQQYVPNFEAHETNPEGKVSEAVFRDGKYRSSVQDGDMILCRVNAPLVRECLAFLKEGRRATIIGNAIGKGLVNLIRKLDAVDIPDLVQKLDEWLQLEIRKENARPKPSKNRMDALQDRHECIEHFIEGQRTVEEVITRIEGIFSETSRDEITLSSIHRAKGLERSRVFLLCHKRAQIPHPMAKTDAAKECERSLLYIAITRAIHEFTYVR